MPNLDMLGPFPFVAEKIDKFVTQISAGYFILSHSESNVFRASFVGRSDFDLNGELKLKLNPYYEQFKFGYVSSPQEAFLKECKVFHDFGGSDNLDNKTHPSRQPDSDWKCPYCGLFS